MRLLLINYELPPIGGGGGRATLRLGQEFVRLGHEVAILTSAFLGFPREERLNVRPTPGPSPSSASERPCGGGILRVRRLPAWRPWADRCPPHHMLTFVLSSLWFAPRFAREFRPDLVFAFFGIPCGPAAREIKRRLHVPYALSLRGSDVPRRELGHQRLLETLTKPLLRRVWRDADALIAVGKGLRDAALAVEPGLSIHVIPNGVDIERFLAAGAPRRPSGEGPFRLLFVGRLREFKGVQFVLEALARRPASAQPVRLDIVGDGPYRRELERIVRRRGLSDRVAFHGWLPPDKVPRYYAEAHALVLPSFAEGSPNVVLEAMAAGLPVIASDAPGIREIVENGAEGWLTPPGDAGAIGEAIERLVPRDEMWSAMSANCLQTAILEYSWAEIARRHLEIFEKLVS